MSTSVRVESGADTALHLVSAVLMYKSDCGAVYATSHGMQVDAEHPGRKVLGPGAPLTKKGLTALARAIDVATAFAGFIPENLLYSAPDMLVWWAPAGIRTTWFTGTAMGEQSGPCGHPALVFAVTAANWHVFALRESTRPTPATPLMHAPHLNIYESGAICTGNVRLPPAISADAIAQYEDAFFRSHFTHPNHPGAVDYPGGTKQLWLDQLARPDVSVVNCALKPAKQTLGEAIKKIASRINNNH